jgi:hypothetical protein
LPRVVARAALIAVLASVVAPGLVGSRMPSAPEVIDQSAFSQVDLRPGSTVTAYLLDPANRSEGTLTGDAVFDEQLAGVDLGPSVRAEAAFRASALVRVIPPPAAPKRASGTTTTRTRTSSGSGGSSGGSGGGSGGSGGSGGTGGTGGSAGATWSYAAEVSWYGPGFYGNGTACGQTLTKSLLGVANRTLPCGTKVTFKYGSRVVTVRVVDRGPYVSGRNWDLTYAACTALAHCFTGPIYYRIGG